MVSFTVALESVSRGKAAKAGLKRNKKLKSREIIMRSINRLGSAGQEQMPSLNSMRRSVLSRLPGGSSRIRIYIKF